MAKALQYNKEQVSKRKMNNLKFIPHTYMEDTQKSESSEITLIILYMYSARDKRKFFFEGKQKQYVRKCLVSIGHVDKSMNLSGENVSLITTLF